MRRALHRLLALTGAASAFLVCCSAASAGTFPLDICGSSARDPGDGLTWASASPLIAGPTCPAGGAGLLLASGNNQTFHNGATASFKVTAPPGIVIYGIHVVNARSQGVGINQYGSSGWWGEFYWNGGPGIAGRSGPINPNAFNTYGCCSQTNLQSRTMGWFFTCGQSNCATGSSGVSMNMTELDLTAEEDQPPGILPTGAANLWTQSGWVRGSWNTSFVAADPSGVCGAAVVFGSLPAIVTPTPDTAPNRHRWKQCPDQSVPATVDTTASDGSLGRGEGAMQLRLTATNTADVTANPAKTVYVDNTTPTLALSGPTDEPSTAGTQYVNAVGAGSPSGIGSVTCTVDGGPPQIYAGSQAHVPVGGVGQHTVSCVAQNNAVDAAGRHGVSPAASWSLKIGQPTIVGVAFDKLEGLACHRARVRVRIPGHWITVRRHGRLVKVKTRARTGTELVMRCHPRTVSRRTVVFVSVRRHGHLVRVKRMRVVRVVIPPRVVANSSRVVGFGHGTTVNGWLGTSTGVALPGRSVQVLCAPDNGSGQFSAIATARTAADGSWSAFLPRGPSRVVEALYNGDPTTESASSGQVRVIVPAKVKLLSVSPRRVAWGGTVRITGQLLGGYLPPGGALVRLRIGEGRRYQTYGVQEHVTGNGRFSTTYTFGAGVPSVYRTYFFQIATLPMGNYPYAPAASGRRTVLVGGHPNPH